MNRIEVMSKIKELLDARADNPADDLIKMGEALMTIGKALKGQSPADARAILSAVAALELGATSQ